MPSSGGDALSRQALQSPTCTGLRGSETSMIRNSGLTSAGPRRSKRVDLVEVGRFVDVRLPAAGLHPELVDAEDAVLAQGEQLGSLGSLTSSSPCLCTGWLVLLALIGGGGRRPGSLAEVDPARQLAHDQQVRSRDHVGTQGARSGERGARPHRAQVGEQAEPCVVRGAPARGAARRGRSCMPAWTADRARQYRVGGAAGRPGHRPSTRCRARRSMRRPPRYSVGNSPTAWSAAGGADDLGADAVRERRNARQAGLAAEMFWAPVWCCAVSGCAVEPSTASTNYGGGAR